MPDSSLLIKINAKVSKELRDAARAACEAESRTFSNIIRVALREWLENNKYLDLD